MLLVIECFWFIGVLGKPNIVKVKNYINIEFDINYKIEYQFIKSFITKLDIHSGKPMENNNEKQMEVSKYDRQIRLWGPRGQKKLS